MFRATMCPSSGKTAVFVWHLVLLFCVDDWYAGAYAPPYKTVICSSIPGSHAGAYDPPYQTVMQEHMLLHTRQSSRSICSSISDSHSGAYAPPYQTVMQEHMLLHTRQSCRSICTFIPDSHPQNNKYQVSHKHSCFSWWWAHSLPKHVEIDIYIYTNNKCSKNILYTNLALFTRLKLIVPPYST